MQDEVIWLPPPVLNHVECRGDDGYGNQTGHRYTLTTVEGPLLRYRLTSVFTVHTDDELEDEPEGT